MRNQLITEFDRRVSKVAKKQKREFRPGDTVRVHYKIQEGTVAEKDKEKGENKKKYRIQVFEGVVTRFRKGLANSSFTVRKISANGVGVERVFPFYSVFVDKVEVMAKGSVRQSRLFYLRNLSGKAARIRSRYIAKGLGSILRDETEEATPAETAAPIEAATEEKQASTEEKSKS